MGSLSYLAGLPGKHATSSQPDGSPYTYRRPVDAWGSLDRIPNKIAARVPRLTSDHQSSSPEVFQIASLEAVIGITLAKGCDLVGRQPPKTEGERRRYQITWERIRH